MSMLLPTLFILLSQLMPIVPTPSEEQPPVVTMQVRSCTSIVSPGQWLILACTFTIPENWHIYWKNPGASGVPTTITVETPSGFQVSPTVYPRPQLINSPSGMTYGYQKEVTLLQPIRTPSTWSGDTDQLLFKVKADWFVCSKDKCFIGSDEKRMRLPWKNEIVDPEPWAQELLEQPAYPKPLRMRPKTTAEIKDGMLVIQGLPTKSNPVGFIPDPTPGVILGPALIHSDKESIFLQIPMKIQPENLLGEVPLAKGLLTFGEKATMSAYEVSVPIEAVSTETETTREQKEQP